MLGRRTGIGVEASPRGFRVPTNPPPPSTVISTTVEDLLGREDGPSGLEQWKWMSRDFRRMMRLRKALLAYEGVSNSSVRVPVFVEEAQRVLNDQLVDKDSEYDAGYGRRMVDLAIACCELGEGKSFMDGMEDGLAHLVEAPLEFLGSQRDLDRLLPLLARRRWSAPPPIAVT